MQKKTSGKKDDNAETEKNSRKEEEFSESMKEPSQKDMGTIIASYLLLDGGFEEYAALS